MASAGDDGAEVKLATTREERFRCVRPPAGHVLVVMALCANRTTCRIEKLADLYAILLTTEHLETAYVRDAVTAGDYAPACAKLIAQFKTVKVSGRIVEGDTFSF